MHIIALKMLMGDRAKYLGLVLGITFATMLMSQQVSMFFGIINRTASQIIDISEADIWVTSPEVKYIDEIIPLPDFELYRTRGTEGVEWAVPLFKGLAQIKTYNGQVQQVILLGLDDYSLIGKPPKIVMGSWDDLNQEDALIIDKAGWEYMWPKTTPVIGTIVEINERRAKIAGVCIATPPFMTYPVVYTKYSNASKYIPQNRKRMSFILVKAAKGYDPKVVAKNISDKTGMQALTSEEFKWRSIMHYLTKTGIPINFGITVALGFIIGATIAAQTFYIFIIENLKKFGTLKAIGVTNQQILMMVVVQTLTVAAIGFSIGIGLVAIFFESVSNINTFRGFYLYGQVVLGTAVTVLLIVLMAGYVSVRKVLTLDPATVFKG